LRLSAIYDSFVTGDATCSTPWFDAMGLTPWV
jgi:hypothetical protein